MTSVRIGATEYPLEDVQENPAKYARALERAKTIQGFAECGCSLRSPRPKLVIRRYSGAFLLARWPEQAHLHSPSCRFHQRTAGSESKGAELDAFRQRDGHHDVRLDLSLFVSARSPAKSSVARTPSAVARPQRRTAGLLAFLEYAWEAAGLNVWPGHGGRGWNICWSQLTTELADCRINGKPGDALLHVMERWDPSRKTEILAELEAFRARLKPTAEANPRGLVIGEIEAHKPTQYGGMLILRQSKQAYFASAALYERILRSYALPLAGIGKPDQRCVAILAAERSKSNYLTVVDAAAMLTNRQFLPCDSSHEIAMADHLIAQQRAFRKPVRHLGRAAVHPDFVLTDTKPETVIEVLGMTGDPNYDARMEEKRRHYANEVIPYIEWDANVDYLRLLRLPPANSRAELDL
ncbi:DUF1173 family protein [Cupriavidus sp. WS]|uniref:DUF1173 family protein n=1 Tax=Cupriavidus sp. WS TaxID=1312922 RepID=UPI00035F2BB1|nr:DUF1173 family protein [Cupriavidus sp. WS]